MSRNVMSVIEGGLTTQRVCLSCKEMKSFDEFQKDIHGYMQKKARCRTCCNKKQREVDYPKNKRSGLVNRQDKVLNLYGVSYEFVKKTLDDQFGLCANRGCGKQIYLDATMGADKAVIDHDHSTGEFRAVLCLVCNLTLGKIENDRACILGLMDYLNKHDAKKLGKKTQELQQ